MSVPLGDARERALPLVSVKSGAPADGYAPVKVSDRTIHLPLTQAEFTHLSDLRHRQRWVLYGGAGCLAFGIALSRFALMVPLALVIAVLSAVLWAAIWLALRAFLPGMEIDGASVRLSRVHRGFVAAVAEFDS